MASKRRRQDRKRAKRQAAKKESTRPQSPESLPPLPDRRVLEGRMQQIFGGMLGTADGSPLHQAQQLMYEAFENGDPEEQVRLARLALKISPDCADAYSVLAEYAGCQEDMLNILRVAVAAGERALGEEAFKEDVGHFWGILETRPYMRARLNLAQHLWTIGQREEAVDHYQDMLRLNPGDNQGVRWILADHLLELGRDDDLYCLLNQYDDATATWKYSRALLAFRQDGECGETNQLLLEATKGNGHVVSYLVGHKMLPRELPDHFSIGDETEAIIYAAHALPAWKASPGAIGWLRKVVKPSPPEPPKRRKPSQTRRTKALAGLPQVEGEIWEADICPFPEEVEIDGELVRPEMFVVLNQTEREVLTIQPAFETPTPEKLWELLVQCMLHPSNDEPHRPSEIHVRSEEFRNEWNTDDIGIKCVVADNLAVDQVLDEAAGRLSTGANACVGPIDIDELARLPQNLGEVWQTSSLWLPTWVADDDGELKRPRMAVVTSRSEDFILKNDMLLTEPPTDWLWETTAKAMAGPSAGDPRRPGLIQVRSQTDANVLRPHLEGLGVDCVVCDDLDQLDSVIAELVNGMNEGKEPPALVDMPGLSPEQIGSYFQAAAFFYRQAPWQRVLGDLPIKVECDSFQTGTWYALVMGQAGMTLGLTLYEDLTIVRKILSGRLSDEENCRINSAISVIFDEKYDMPFDDLDAIEEHGWSVAGSEAYPLAIRVNPGRAVRSLLAWELELTEACLRAIPRFAKAEPHETKQIRVKVAGKDLILTMQWCPV